MPIIVWVYLAAMVVVLGFTAWHGLAAMRAEIRLAEMEE
jgi:hypothetical protein